MVVTFFGEAAMFSDRSIWTMVHGIGLSGAALLAMAAALFYLYAARSVADGAISLPSRDFTRLNLFAAAALWLSVLIGTYVIFPLYRATPPEGVVDLAAYPRAMILADPANAWLHGFAMEIKEHVPWIAAMLMTAVAYVAWRYRARLLGDAQMRAMTMGLIATALALVTAVALLGIFVNKFAPLQ